MKPGLLLTLALLLLQSCYPKGVQRVRVESEVPHYFIDLRKVEAPSHLILREELPFVPLTFRFEVWNSGASYLATLRDGKWIIEPHSSDEMIALQEKNPDYHADPPPDRMICTYDGDKYEFVTIESSFDWMGKRFKSHLPVSFWSSYTCNFKNKPLNEPIRFVRSMSRKPIPGQILANNSKDSGDSFESTGPALPMAFELFDAKSGRRIFFFEGHGRRVQLEYIQFSNPVKCAIPILRDGLLLYQPNIYEALIVDTRPYIKEAIKNSSFEKGK